MFKIVRTPSILKPFFRSLTSEFHWEHASYFTQLVLAMAASWGRRTVSNLYRHLNADTHRTRFNNFLNVGRWDPAALLRKKAHELLRRLKLKRGQTMYLVIDDSLRMKRAKKMEALGFFRDPTSGRSVRGHHFVTAVLQVFGIVIPWGIRLYAKKEAARVLKTPFKKTTQLAAEMIAEFHPPKGVRVVVLFDSYYLCPTVVSACRRKGFHFISVVKGNRNLYRNGRKLKARRYVPGIWKRREKRVVRSGGSTYRAVDAGWVDLNGVGRVHLIASRRVGEKRVLGLVSDLPRTSMTTIIRTYAQRWCIEQFFKDTKQLLGLGQYQNGSYRAAVTHLHLVCFAYALLTHLRLVREGAQGKRRAKAAKSLSTRWRNSGCSTASMQNELRRMLFLDLAAYLNEEHHSGDSFVKELQRLWVA